MNLQALSNDMGMLAEDARALMAATTEVAEEEVVEARDRLGIALDGGERILRRVRDKAVEGARAADQTVQGHPYQTIGIAFGVGALVGLLLARRNGSYIPQRKRTKYYIPQITVNLMNTPDPLPQQTSPVNEKSESPKALPTDEGMIDFASMLDDFMGEEVLDKEGAVIGTLACYWESVSGLLVFLGIKVNGNESVRVVPGRRSQVDDRHACIRLGYDAVDIESAPCLECAIELDATLERSVYKHFHIREPEPHGGLRYFAGQP